MKHIIGYILAYFAGGAVMFWFLTTEDGKDELAEVLDLSGRPRMAAAVKNA